MKEVFVPSDSFSSPRQEVPFMQVEIGELESPYVDLPPSSLTPHIHNSNISLDYEFDFSSDDFSP